ncbi:hypothetical protein BGW37DRAFT_497555 [Umbelopsis sp. PMI_123]|nr:hypothetical protein BGW37DRAFT_497555 [Umbelopsis sp. PMI_123]
MFAETNVWTNVTLYETEGQNVCSKMNDCYSCTQNDQCGYCVLSQICVPGNWLGPSDIEACSGGRLQYYYGQCTVSHKPILIAATSIASVIIFTMFILFFRCCFRSRNSEYRPLLPSSGSGLVRRSSTFYQFNRNVPGSRRKPSLTERPWPNAKTLSASASTSSQSRAQTDDDPNASQEVDTPQPNDYKAIKWDERRKELLKKYGRSPER